MRALFIAICLLFPVLGYGAVRVGEQVPNLCFTDTDSKKVCLDDFGKIPKVILYSAGWCGPCLRKAEEMGRRYKIEAPEGVQFIYAIAESSRRRVVPTAAYLGNWATRYKITFPVVSSAGDFGSTFDRFPSIPNCAVLTKSNALLWFEEGPSVDAIFRQAKRALDAR